MIDKDLMEKAKKILKDSRYRNSSDIKSFVNNKDLIEGIAQFAQDVRDEAKHAIQLFNGKKKYD